MSNILHVSANIYPTLSKEHSTKKIWRELAKEFQEYHILGRSDDNHFHTEQEGKLYLHRIPQIGGSKFFFVSSFLMLRYIRKYKIDRILCQCALLGGFAAVFYSRILKIPVMVEIHDSVYFEIRQSKNWMRRFVSKILRYSYENASKVRVLNDLMGSMLSAQHVNANTVVIENRVNLDIFSNKKEEYGLHSPIKIISVGNFNWRKGYLQAIEIIQQLQEKYHISLTLIGGGALKEAYIKQIGNADGFILYDYLPQEEFKTIMTEADIYIQPSLREGMPRTLLEAMACGLPIISSDAGFTAGSVLPNRDALIFEAGNFEQFKCFLVQMIEDKELRMRLACQAYGDACERFDWNKQFQRYRKELLDM